MPGDHAGPREHHPRHQRTEAAARAPLRGRLLPLRGAYYWWVLSKDSVMRLILTLRPDPRLSL